MLCNCSKIFTGASVHLDLLCPNNLHTNNILQQIYGPELKKIIGNQNIMVNIYRIQAHDYNL